MNHAIGIDLGTTYSVAAVIEDGRARVIRNGEGEYLTPSVFAVSLKGDPLAGAPARAAAAYNPERAVASIKRHIGTDYRAFLDGRGYSPQEISAFILKKIKTDVEARMNAPMEKAVITVPAYFNDAQRQATREAAAIAGIEVMRIINEPTAAALAYGLHRSRIQTVLVWDLGGGTFDVSLLEMGDGIFQVKAVNGNTRLGGDDWDDRMVDYLAVRFLKEHQIDLKSDNRRLYHLREMSETAKRELSYRPGTRVYISPDVVGKKGLGAPHVWVERTEFEAVSHDLRDKLESPTRQVLADAGLDPQDIDRIVLVGGSTRMPCIRDLAEKLFQKRPYARINPDEVVAIGAAVQAGILTGEIEDVVLVDVTPLSLGIETEGGLFARLIHRNTTIPTSAGRIFTNAVDDQTVMDIHVLQGEREMAADNISLGNFQLSDIPPLPRGKAQVEVTFEIDANGMVNVSAEELYTGVCTRITVEAAHLLSEEQVAEAIQEAQGHVTEDMEKREQVQTGIQAHNMLRAADTILAKNERQLGRITLEQMQTAVSTLRQGLAEGDNGCVRDAMERLKKLLEGMRHVL
ncbi:MAG: molecular chaperone DnaK [Desulfatiglandaceae bacterium]